MTMHVVEYRLPIFPTACVTKYLWFRTPQKEGVDPKEDERNLKRHTRFVGFSEDRVCRQNR